MTSQGSRRDYKGEGSREVCPGQQGTHVVAGPREVVAN